MIIEEVTTAVMLASNLLISAMRHLIADSVRIPVFILLIATLVTSKMNTGMRTLSSC